MLYGSLKIWMYFMFGGLSYVAIKDIKKLYDNRRSIGSYDRINSNRLYFNNYDGNMEELYDKYKIRLYTDWIIMMDIDDRFPVLKQTLMKYGDKGFTHFIDDIDNVLKSFDIESMNKFLSIGYPNDKNSIHSQPHQLFIIKEAHNDLLLIVNSYIL